MECSLARPGRAQLEHAGLVSVVEVAVVDAQSDAHRFSWPEGDPALTVDVEKSVPSMDVNVSVKSR